MNKAEVEERIKKVIIECKEEIKAEEINEDSNLIFDFMFDSINIIDLIGYIEDEFDIEIGDEYLDADKLSSFSELTRLVMLLSEEQE